MGFDDSVLEEKKFPTKHDLDQVSTEFPISKWCVLSFDIFNKARIMLGHSNQSSAIKI